MTNPSSNPVLAKANVVINAKYIKGVCDIYVSAYMEDVSMPAIVLKFPGTDEAMEYFAKASVNIVAAAKHLPKNTFFMKSWAENEGLEEEFLVQGLSTPTSMCVHTGHVTANVHDMGPELKTAWVKFQAQLAGENIREQ